VIQDLGRPIRRSQNFTYQLYSGYRGSGKTTELLRLRKDLEDRGHIVVYFAADERDLSVQDAQHTDILLACTRHLLQGLKQANPDPVLDWLKTRWADLQDVLLTEVTVDQVNLAVGLKELAKLTSAIRAQPGQRQKIRERLEPHTESLIDALNRFIQDNSDRVAAKTKLVVIADNLDRIVPIFRDHGRSNHEEIFLDRSEQLKALNCHIIYTVPISMVYSRWSTELEANYGIPRVLPSIMVRQEDNQPYQPGLDILRTMILRRVPTPLQDSLVPTVFESEQVLQKLCLMSGGYSRDLMILVREAINKTEMLPIGIKAINSAIGNLRDVYERAIEPEEWIQLAQVSLSKQVTTSPSYLSLLFKRCMLQYSYFDESGTRRTFLDVHPVIEKLDRYTRARSDLLGGSKSLSSPDESIDNIVVLGLEDLYRQYQHFLDQQDYKMISNLSSQAVEFLDGLVKPMDSELDRDSCRKLVALRSYWQLNANLYKARI
jgi:hypothetical protein